MTRKIPNPDLLNLARRLLSYEAAHHLPDDNAPPVAQVGDKLRRSLSRLTGTAGFRSLAVRALTMGRAEVPALNAVQIGPDGSLDGLDALGDQDSAEEAGVMLIAQLLALLVVLIGESFVLNFVLNVWPDLPASDDRTLEKQ